MEKLPADVSHKIFCFLDHKNLATAEQACDNILWCNLFKERWGEGHAAFYAPFDHRSWKGVYEVQDRCDRVGLGLKIIREGSDYYLVRQGIIQRYLGSRNATKISSGRSNLKRVSIPERSRKLRKHAQAFLTTSSSSLVTWKLPRAMQNEIVYCRWVTMQ
ncbi:hypothetical protein IFM89_001813 [Coptis chinensis]|uniref:F-box domain-containing protein n=1 Tax=Coptis chinensis TaxID=261450 RepID=A0A835HK92_9MAGN|nr:hypothetical protein IFM89_001813 [Coptis chinensis]